MSRVVSEFASIDQALDRLRGPTTMQERLGILQELVHAVRASYRVSIAQENFVHRV